MIVSRVTSPQYLLISYLKEPYENLSVFSYFSPSAWMATWLLVSLGTVLIVFSERDPVFLFINRNLASVKWHGLET